MKTSVRDFKVRAQVLELIGGALGTLASNKDWAFTEYEHDDDGNRIKDEHGNYVEKSVSYDDLNEDDKIKFDAYDKAMEIIAQAASKF